MPSIGFVAGDDAPDELQAVARAAHVRTTRSPHDANLPTNLPRVRRAMVAMTYTTKRSKMESFPLRISSPTTNMTAPATVDE